MPGTYSDAVTIQSNVNTVGVSVIMQVTSGIIEPDAGFLYTLLIDDVTGDVVQQDARPASDGEYAFTFEDVPDGFYSLVAGTDSDNDGFICDSGEACGGFLTLFAPQVIEVNDDRDGLDFSVGHIVAIPALSHATETRPEVPTTRLPRRVNKEIAR